MPWNQSSSDISSIFTGTLPLNQFGGYLAWLQPEPGNGVISHILCREPTGKSFTATNGTDGMPFGGHNTVPTRDQSQNGNPKPPNKFIVQKKPISSILSRVKNPWMHVIISQFRAKMEQISLWNGLLEMSLVNTALFSFFLFYTCLSPT